MKNPNDDPFTTAQKFILLHLYLDKKFPQGPIIGLPACAISLVLAVLQFVWGFVVCWFFAVPLAFCCNGCRCGEDKTGNHYPLYWYMSGWFHVAYSMARLAFEVLNLVFLGGLHCCCTPCATRVLAASIPR